MDVSKKTVESLNKLCGALYLEYPKDSYKPEAKQSIMSRIKPNDIKEGSDYVELYGKYHWLYRQVLSLLRKELSLEFLKDRELDEELWHLTCEIILLRPSFSNFNAVKKRIRQFTFDIVKPIIEYEVLIPILYIDVRDKIIQIGDSIIKSFDETKLIEWGITKESGSPYTFQRFLNKSCFIIREKGNNEHLACNRAREKAYFLMKLLQVALTSSRVLHDVELLYKLGSEVAIREVNQPDNVGFDWIRGFTPIRREIDDKLESDVNSFFEKVSSTIFDGDPDLKKSFRTAITWIGRSVEEEDLDIKIIYLSTALESILTSRSDDKKGETIAYRMLLLNTYLEDSFVHPSRVLYIYELRSEIVHGSKLAVSTMDDYLTMRHIARATIENAILAIKKMGVNRKSDFHNLLDKNEKAVELVLNWLREQGDSRSNTIGDYMEKKCVKKLNVVHCS